MGISAGNKKMVGGHFISDIIDSDVLKILLGTREVFSAYVLVWKTKTFSYTGADQVFEVPEDCNMTIECWGAGSNNAAGGYAKGVIAVTKGQKISFMIGGNGGRTNDGTTYGFGGSTTYGGRGGGGLSGAFTGDTAIGANDASRVLVIAGGAGGGRTGGGAGGGENGQNGNGGSYGYPGAGGTQTGRGSGGNTRSEQFRGGGGSGTYGFGGGGGWRGGNGSGGDGSGDDDAQAGGGSGHVIDSATDVVLTQGGGSTAGQDGSVKIRYLVKERPQPKPKIRLPLEYQEVAYIQATGTQYIDNITLPVDFKFTIKASFDTTSSYYNIYDTASAIPMLWVDTSGRFELNIDYKYDFSKNTFIEVVSDNTGNYNLLYIDGTQVLQGNKVSSISGTTSLLHRGVSDGFKGKIKCIEVRNSSNVLLYNFIPCYRRIDGAIGLYDLVNKVFYSNAGTGTFLKGADVNVPELPQEYTEVEYLQSVCSGAGATSSGQIIDTLFVPTNKTRVGFKISGWTQSGTSNQIFGEDINWTQGDGGFAIVTDNYSYNGPASNRPTGFNDGAVHHGTMGFNGVYRDGTLVDNSRAGQALNATQTISLFGLHRNGTYVEHSSCKIHYFIIEEDGVLVKFFMPCYRKLDNKPGMYDLINKEFYTNVGTGEFTCGGELIRHYVNNEHTILYWPLSGTSKDLSGTNSDGVATSISYPEVNGTNIAQFTASSSNIYTDNSFVVNCNGTQQFTYALWFKIGAMPASGKTYEFGWCGKTNYGACDKLFRIASDGSLECYNYVSTSYSVTAPAGTVTTNIWYCMVYTYDGVKVRVYLNKRLVGEVAAPGSYNYSNEGGGRFILGRISGNTTGFQGYVGDVVMEDTSRGDDWIDEYYNNTYERYIPTPIPFTPGENTEVYYNFDNQDLSDSSGKGRDSSWYNGTGSFTDGLKGKCAQISGTRGIRLPITLPSGDFTYSICAYTTNLTSPAIQSFLGTVEWGSNVNYIHFHWTSGDSQKIVLSFSDSTGNVPSSATMEANKWINIILVHSGNKYCIYKNGEKILDFDKAGFTPSAGTWTIGCEYTDGRAINGKIDEVILESQAWSEDRIKGYVSSLGLL